MFVHITQITTAARLPCPRSVEVMDNSRGEKVQTAWYWASWRDRRKDTARMAFPINLFENDEGKIWS